MLVYSTYAGAVIVSLVLFGCLSDTVGRRRVLLPAVRTFAWIIGTAALAVSVLMSLMERRASRASRPHLARPGVGS
jgi:MFS family permease